MLLDVVHERFFFVSLYDLKYYPIYETYQKFLHHSAY